MTLWDRLRSPFAWIVVRNFGVYAYQRNTITGRRRAIRIHHGGHSPVDRHWLETGEWQQPSRPPAPAPMLRAGIER